MSDQLELGVDLDRRKHDKKALKFTKASEAKPKKVSTHMKIRHR